MPVLPVSDLLIRRDPIALACDFPDVAEGCRLAGSVTVSPNGSGFRLYGSLTGEAQLTCDRCLRPFRRPLSITLNETFVVRRARAGGDRRLDALDDVSEMDPEETLDERDTLDLADLARQWAVMETSGQRLCGDPACQY